MLPGTGLGIDGHPESEPISVSELYHENSKQHAWDLSFSRRIGAINRNPALHGIISRAFKTYPVAETVALPDARPGDGPSFERVAADRRSQRDFTGEPLELEEVSKICYFGNGITGKLGAHGEEAVQLVRAIPSGGALYPVELYALLPASPEVEAGLYHYAVEPHALERLASGDFTAALARSTAYGSIFARAGMTIILTAMFGRVRFKYGERGYRFTLLETGHVAQNVLLGAAALGLGAVPIGGFLDDDINDLLGIDGVDEASLYLIAVGRPVTLPSPAQAETVMNTIVEMLWNEQLSGGGETRIAPRQTDGARPK